MALTETLRLVVDGTSKGAKKALTELRGEAKTTGSTLSSSLSKASNAAAAGVVALTGVIAKSVADFETYGSQVKAIMRSTGMAADGASTLAGEWKRYGIDASTGSVGIKKLAQQITEAREGSESATAAFEALGISQEELASMSDTEAIFAVRDALSEMEAGLERTSIATTLLGRGAQSMSAWYNASVSSMAETNQLLADSGLVWDDEDVDAYTAAAKAQAELKISLAGLEQVIAREVVPGLTDMVEGVVWFTDKLGPLAKAIPYLTVALGAFVGVDKTVAIVQTVSGWIAAHTAAVTADTLATEANTAAQAQNRLALIASGGRLRGIISILPRFIGGFRDSRVAASAFSGVAGTLGGKLRILANGGLALTRTGFTKLATILKALPALLTATGGIYAAIVAAIAADVYIIYKAVDAWQQWRDAIDQANQAYSEFQSNYASARQMMVEKYGEGSAKVKEWDAANKPVAEQAAADQYQIPWWLKPQEFINSLWGLAEGGTVKARPGGTLIRAAEAGEDEDFVPASRRVSWAVEVLTRAGLLNDMAGGGTLTRSGGASAVGRHVTINVKVDAGFIEAPTRSQVRRLSQLIGDDLMGQVRVALAGSNV